MVLVGRVWAGGDAEPAFGAVVLDADGRIVEVGTDPGIADRAGIGGIGDRFNIADRRHIADRRDIAVVGGPQCWIGPGVTDAHVHQAFAGVTDRLGPGLVGARDLGAPLGRALAWQRAPGLAVSGPILTAPQGYPSRSWGADGFARFVDSPVAARAAVAELAAAGVDVVKVALEPAGGTPVPGPATVRAIVDAAHAAGLGVVAHALDAAMVNRAVDAGVDELAHTPTERLSDADIEAVATAGISVVSTLQTFFAAGIGRAAAANAADLVAAGVVLRYGTDLGNAGTDLRSAGVDPRELDRLADTGLGRRGALIAATLESARAPGQASRGGRHRGGSATTGLLNPGSPAHLVLLEADPESEPAAWCCPRLTVIGGVVQGAFPPPGRR